MKVLFSPIAGEEAIFYAATTDIPPTKSGYDKENNKLILEISTQELSENISINNEIELKNNTYISGYEIIQKDEKTFIEISLNKATVEYSMRKDEGDNDLPYFSVAFR